MNECIRRAALTAALSAAAVAGAAGPPPTGASIPFGAHGDAVNGTSGQPVALTPVSLLVTAEGPDGVAGNTDDETLLVTGIGIAPGIVALPTPGAATNASRIERLSATRAAMVSAGSDGVFGNADDALLFLDRLGSSNTVTPVVLGGLGDNQQFTPERLDSDTVVIPTLGADFLADNADDDVAIVTASTGAFVRLAAPNQRAGGRTRVVALSPTVFLLSSDGPDKKSSGADDLVYLFRNDGTGWTRTDLAVPGLNRRAAGRPVRLSARFGLVTSAGPDFADSTADDKAYLLDAVDGTAVPLAVPFARNSSAGQVTALADDIALLSSRGVDGLDGTADDSVAVLSGLGGTPVVTFVVVGATVDNNECRPVRLDDATFALGTLGSDRILGNADDEVTVVSGIGGEPVVQRVVVGALAAGTTSTLVPLSASALLLSAGGPDHVVGTPDDAVVVLSGIGGTITVQRVAIAGALDSADAFRFVPSVLGGGRAALLSSGADNTLGAGGDDGVRILGNLQIGRDLSVGHLRVRLARQPTGGRMRPARVSVRAILTVEDADALLSEDLTISVGNASQTLAAGSLEPIRGGRLLAYSDPEGAKGIVRSLRIDPATGDLRMEVRGADQDIATTSAGYCPVGFELGDDLIPEAVAAKIGKFGFVYNRHR